jgi:hypothetical protein
MTFENLFFIDPALKRGPGDWTFGALKNAVDPHPSLRATLSHKERENNKWRCGPNRRFVPRRCNCVMKRLLVALKSALSCLDLSLALGERVAEATAVAEAG